MRNRKVKQILCALLCGTMVATMLPVQAFAAGDNRSPELLRPYSGTVEAGKVLSITADELDSMFYDPDGDDLTYWIKVDDSAYIEVQDKCVYTPEGTESYTLTLKANDGKTDSEEYSFTLPNTGRILRSFAAAPQAAAVKKLSSLLIYHTDASPKDSNVLLKNALDTYATEQIFSPDVFDYTIAGTFYDTDPKLRFRATAEDAEADITLTYLSGKTAEIYKDGKTTYANDILTAGKNEFTITVGDSSQVYTFRMDVIPTLSALSTDGMTYWDKTFQTAVTKYTVEVPADTKTLDFAAECTSEGCTVTYNGESSSAVDISECDKVEIVVAKDGITNTYTVNLDKQTVYDLTINTVPEDAAVVVTDHAGNNLTPDADGSYSGMFAAHDYTYSVSRSGYVMREGTVPAQGGTVDVILQRAPGQPSEVSAYWPNFRGSNNNMAIVDVRTPTSAQGVAAKWVKGFGGQYPSVSIIVDNALIVMADKTLYKLDLETGEVLQSATMAAAPNYGYTPPTYGAGMIFCPLAGGTIQAFNADTLESLWIYQDDLKGQSLSPITYADGYIYTGFWRKEKERSEGDADANYVCIDVTDEDTDKTDESKSAVWKHKHLGGFYWAGSVVIGNAVIVGTDDGQAEGTNGSSMLYAFDRKTGEIISSHTLSGAGDQRSSIAYDAANGRIYFTTKGGYLYSAAVNSSTGQISDLKRTATDMQITSTPVVYGDRVYFGLGNGFTSGYLAVADADTLEILFMVTMQGYPQSSVLLSTAYEDSGYIYLYTTYNTYPGGLSMIKVKTNCKTKADAELIELYDADGYSEHCIASPICAADGTIYFKNDSGNIFAIGVPSHTNVIQMINEIGTVTLESEGKIAAARAAYDALSSTDQKKVTNYSTLTAAESKLNELKNKKADEVEKLISAIGQVTLNSGAKIQAARSAYDKLTAAEKTLVSNYTTLTNAEKRYENLRSDAVSNVEELINAIGTVTADSKTKIEEARAAYNNLSSDLQALVENYSVLTAAETALANLNSGTASGTTATLGDATIAGTVPTTQTVPGTTTTTTTTGGATSITTHTIPGGTATLTKSELLQLQEELDSVDSEMDYETALEFLKEISALEESQQLALAESAGMKTLQAIVAKGNHEEATTGICVEGLAWNIRLVAGTDGAEAVREDIEKRLDGADVLCIWDLHLEDVLTGEIYYPENTITIHIPMRLLGDYTAEQLSIIHYNAAEDIEILNGEIRDEYLVFDAVEFSYYAVADYQLPDAQAAMSDGVEGKSSAWILWIILAAAGIAALAAMLYLRFGGKEKEGGEAE